MIDHGFGVSLGPINRAHLPYLQDWRNDYRIWKWCRQHDLISDADQDAWFERQRTAADTRMYLIHDREDRAVGVCGLTSIDWVNGRAEFSLYIAPNFWGNGLGSSALETLLSHGFKTLNLNCIWGESFDGNPATRMFERVGFKYEGSRRSFYFREGKYIDAKLYSILSHEFLGERRRSGAGRDPGPSHSKPLYKSGGFPHCDDSAFSALESSEIPKSGREEG